MFKGEPEVACLAHMLALKEKEKEGQQPGIHSQLMANLGLTTIRTPKVLMAIK